MIELPQQSGFSPSSRDKDGILHMQWTRAGLREDRSGLFVKVIESGTTAMEAFVNPDQDSVVAAVLIERTMDVGRHFNIHVVGKGSNSPVYKMLEEAQISGVSEQLHQEDIKHLREMGIDDPSEYSTTLFLDVTGKDMDIEMSVDSGFEFYKNRVRDFLEKIQDNDLISTQPCVRESMARAIANAFLFVPRIEGSRKAIAEGRY